jgi:4-amino-4-deoxy-L-arabinose transferase-like glycosyltransferase
VRLPAVLLAAISLSAVFLLTRRMYDARIAFLACLAIASSIGGHVVGLLMTIDAPLCCCWSLALYTCWRALDGGTWRWWLATALVCGIGALAKQMMLVFLVLMWLQLILCPPHRRWMLTARPYLTTVLALLAMVPVLAWNAANDWITVEHTSHHFAASRKWSDALRTVPEFIGAELGVVSPVSLCLIAALGTVLLLRFSQQDARTRFLLLFGVVPLPVFVVLSIRQRIQPNWPAVFYGASFILLAAWAGAALAASPAMDRWRRAFRPGLLIGAVSVLAVYLAPFVVPLTPLDGTRADPTARARGWRALANEVAEHLARQPVPAQTFVACNRRYPVSALAFYLPGQPRVYTLPATIGITNQYQLWGGPPAATHAGWSALVLLDRAVDDPRESIAWIFDEAFASWEALGTLTAPIGQHGARTYHLLYAKGFRGWPGEERR